MGACYDLDISVEEVTPLIRFQLTGINVLVVFFHLKSGNEEFASNALDNAIKRMENEITQKQPILWISDFNRAGDRLVDDLKGRTLESGGGVAKWDLDSAIMMGEWKPLKPTAEVVSKSGDNQHIG
jgi:hypothetical protein